jgi:sigma-B regulation protein RsbU (phosphoserine phosphatase)
MSQTSSITIEQVKRVLDVSRLFAVTTDLDPLLTRIAEAATTILGCERASIFIHDAAAGELWTKVALKADEIRVPAASGIVGHALTKNEIVRVDDPYNDPRFNSATDGKSGFKTRSLLAAPMLDIDGHPLGVIQALNKRSGQFSGDDEALIELLAHQAGVAMQRYRLQVAAMEIVALRQEMLLARQVQNAMIPKSAPVIPGLAAAGRAIPASITGGDCFDFWETRDGRLAVLLADAIGHGLAPTLIVSQTRALVRTLSEILPDPKEILYRVNARLRADLDRGRFVTAFLGFISPHGELAWFSAGHAPVFVRRQIGEAIQSLPAHVPPLGLFNEHEEIESVPIHLGKGGFLAVTSDGIFEAFDPQGEQFGVSRLVTLLDELSIHPPEQAIDGIFAAIQQWGKKSDPRDDQTAVVVQVC